MGDEREAVLMTTLSKAQIEQLIRPINPARVAVLDGLSHLEAYDVRAHLIRCFGFGGWSGDVLSMELMYEEPCTLKSGKPGFKVAYRCLYRLSVAGSSYTEAAVGESMMPEFKRGDCHDMAVKTAESQALKRCAVNLGDQFGLSLYRKGSTAPLVLRTLVGEPIDADTVDHGTPDIVPEHPEAPQQEPDAPAEAPAAPPTDPGGVSLSSPDVSDEALRASTAARVEALRLKVEALLADKDTKHAKADLARVQLAAAREKLMNEQVQVEGGEITVAVFLDNCLKSLARDSA